MKFTLRSRDAKCDPSSCRFRHRIFLYQRSLLFFFIPYSLPLYTTMRPSTAHVLPLLSISFFSLARASNLHHHRQIAPSVASASGSTTIVAAASSAGSSAAGTAAATAGSSVSLSGTLLPTPTGPTPSFSLASENPTAVPLSSIVVNAPSAATVIMPSPYPAGTKPSDIPQAPGLPDREHFTHLAKKVT